jgi:Restriction endonuclease BglII
MADEEDVEEEDLEAKAEGLVDDLASAPNEAADPQAMVDSKVPWDIREKYEIISYRNAAVILAETRQAQYIEIMEALRGFEITTNMIRTAGGNESEIPKIFSKALRPLGWHETIIQADLAVTLSWREEIGKTKIGKPVMVPKNRVIKRDRYLDGHKIDYVKDKVAFDLEWNSKDQTFDRDLYAMNAFFLCGAIDVGVLVTRSLSMNDVFRMVGPALTKSGAVEKLKDGSNKPTIAKYGASTTWMGKLIYRLNAGRNGGCPILAVGITPAAVSDLSKMDRVLLSLQKHKK